MTIHSSQRHGAGGHHPAVLERLQHAPEAELMAIADRARSLVETRHRFDRLCDAVLHEVGNHVGA